MEQARSLQVGFTDYLFKPIEPSELVQIVRVYLKPRQTLPDTPGRGRRVLVVDDDPLQRKLLHLSLTNAGFRVATAPDGVAALDAARAAPPDAILSDVLMPRLDGFRLCLAVRQDPRLSRIPVVLVSGAYMEMRTGSSRRGSAPTRSSRGRRTSSRSSSASGRASSSRRRGRKRRSRSRPTTTRSA